MSETVRDVMNRELISLRPDNPCEEALQYLSFLGVHAAPVVDEQGQAVGVLSMADLLGDLTHAKVGDRMSSPALTVLANAPLTTAEEMMTDFGFHHLAVTDGSGKVVGFVSSLDLLRARMGREPLHPSTAPLSACTASKLWSDDLVLDRSGVDKVPSKAGHFVLVADGDLVWAESCHDLQRRLVEVLEQPNARIALFASGGPLAFRFATIEGGPHRVIAAQG